ncbi:MAG: hypothetical protein ACOCRK_05525 [bacterium]
MVEYYKKEEKELFTKLAPNIHKIKTLFEENDLKGSYIELNIIDCINSEIKNITDSVELDNSKGLSNEKYKEYLKEINDEQIKKSINECIKDMLDTIDRFKKEYLEEV